jgi:signal transduction histidine kinase
MLRYLRAFHGEVASEKMAEASGLPLAELEKPRWIEHEQLEKMLVVLRRFAPTDDEVRAATTFDFSDTYGLVRLILWTTSPERLYRVAADAVRLIATTSTITIEPLGPNKIAARHRCSVHESKTACVGRMAHLEALPTLCGLRPAKVRETACQAEGAPECVYVVQWEERARWIPTLVGAVSAAVGAWLGARTGSIPAAVALGLTGLLLGALWSLADEARRQQGTVVELQGALERAVTADEELRRAALALEARQRHWSELVESRVDERARALRDIVARVQELQQARSENLLGWSHDLRNPMFVLQMGADWLDEHKASLDVDARAVVAEQREALDRMRALLAELMRAAKDDHGLAGELRVQVDVRALAVEILGRLRAFAIRKDVHVDVRVGDGVPDRFEANPLLLDRVIDNLLSNAAKYTDRGSIVVEIGAAPGFVSIAVADTGRGMDANGIARVLSPGKPDPSLPAGESYGVGVSIVVRLLQQIGGRLEVASRLGEGTRFVAFFPATA